MAPTRKSQPTLWTRLSANIDALVVICVAAVTALGIAALSPVMPETAEAPAQEVQLAGSAVAPAPAPQRASRPGPARPAPEYYPWTPPEPYLPVLPESETAAIPQLGGGRAFKAAMQGKDGVFSASHHDVGKSFYGGNWRRDNLLATPSGTLLTVQRVKGQSKPYTAAEIQSRQHYGYGRYEAVMRPARGSGLVSAFFTYTGPWFGDPHDEIDIEFLGKDTTKIHFNYFRKGKTGAHETFDLPFDAADADRLYAFEWRPDGITWFVEGVPVYATRPDDPKLPMAAGKIMMSAWTGSPDMAAWHGKPEFTSGSGAHFSCVSFVPLGGEGPSCGDTYVPPVTLSP